MPTLHFVVTQGADHATAWKDYGVPFSTAVLGALLAYVPSRLLAGRASRELLRRDQTNRRDAEVLATRKVFVKLTVLVNSIHDYHSQVEAMIARAVLDGNDHMSIAQRMSAFVGIDRETTVFFEASELEVFIAARQVGYVDDLVLLARRHAAMLSNLEAFGKMKTELHFELAKHGFTTRDTDSVSTTAARMPANLGNYFRVRSDELNLFALQLRPLLASFDAFARDVAARYGPIIREHFGEAGALDLEERPDESPPI
jgi:hypothetical protein